MRYYQSLPFGILMRNSWLTQSNVVKEINQESIKFQQLFFFI